MSNVVGLCDQCGAEGYKTLGAESLCTTHYNAFLLSVDPSAFGFIGKGIQTGPLCPEWGPGWAELTCVACRASWVGPIGEPCAWCVESLEKMIQWQKEKVLTPPSHDLSDIKRPKALEAWTKRLKVARDAGIITSEEAKNHLGRELRRT